MPAKVILVPVPLDKITRAQWKEITRNLYSPAQADLLIRMAQTFADPKGCEPGDRAALDLAKQRLHDKENPIVSLNG